MHETVKMSVKFTNTGSLRTHQYINFFETIILIRQSVALSVVCLVIQSWSNFLFFFFKYDTSI